MKRILAYMLIALIIGSPLAAQGTAETEAQPTVQTVTIVDDNGTEVTVPVNPGRVVVTDIYPLPSVLTVFLDSADVLVGIHPVSMSAAANGLLGQLYPKILESNTSFMTGTSLNIEQLMALKPDVVFFNAAVPSEGEMIRQAGITAVAISAVKWGYDVIKTYDGWIKTLSEIFPGRTEVSQKVTSYSEKVLKQIQSRTADLKEEDKRHVLFLFNYSADKIVTSGSSFFGQYWCDATNTINSANEIKIDNSNAVITMEQIYKWNPDLVFITNFTPAMPEDLYNDSYSNYDWSVVNAVENKQVFKLPLGSYRTYTPGVDTPLTLLWMAKTAYPGLFADVDMKQETRSYYFDIYGITLTDEQIDSMYHSTREAAAGFVK
ncbi:MAG: ABC transporter substrate-binding protein [Sphaerochaetaceae bacterium]